MVDVAQIKQAVTDLRNKVDGMATDIGTVGSNVTAAKTSVDNLIERLEALLAGGSGATQQDLQEILDGLTGASSAIDSADTAAQAVGETAAAIKAEADAERP